MSNLYTHFITQRGASQQSNVLGVQNTHIKCSFTLAWLIHLHIPVNHPTMLHTIVVQIMCSQNFYFNYFISFYFSNKRKEKKTLHQQ